MKQILYALFGAMALSACHKDPEVAPAPTKTELLTSKKWRLSAQRLYITSTSPGSTVPTVDQDTDEYAMMAACERDDFWQFNTDKTLIKDQGPIKCVSVGPQSIIYQWTFSNDEKQLINSRVYVNGATSTDVYTVVELSATTLRLEQLTTLISTTTAGTSTKTFDSTFTYTAF